MGHLYVAGTPPNHQLGSHRISGVMLHPKGREWHGKNKGVRKRYRHTGCGVGQVVGRLHRKGRKAIRNGVGWGQAAGSRRNKESHSSKCERMQGRTMKYIHCGGGGHSGTNPKMSNPHGRMGTHMVPWYEAIQVK